MKVFQNYKQSQQSLAINRFDIAAKKSAQRSTTYRQSLHKIKAKENQDSQIWTPQNNLFIQNQSQPVIPPRLPDTGGDPFGLLQRQRIIFLGGEVTDFAADAAIGQLLLLDNQDHTKDIKMFINSPGGSVVAGMGIYDAMLTYCFGLAASMGAFLLGAGTRGLRYSMPNARIMIHQPLGGVSGQAVDVEIQAKEIMFFKANINRIMSDYTGQKVEKIEEDTDRDRYMSPVEAQEYGIIDHIIGGKDATFNVKGPAIELKRKIWNKNERYQKVLEEDKEKKRKQEEESQKKNTENNNPLQQ